MDPDLGDPSAAFDPLPVNHSAEEQPLLPPHDDGEDPAVVGTYDIEDPQLLGSLFDHAPAFEPRYDVTAGEEALPMSVEEEVNLRGSQTAHPPGVEPSFDAATGKEALSVNIDAAVDLNDSQIADPPAFRSSEPACDYTAGEEALPVSTETAAPAPLKRKRGRPPKSQGVARKAPVPKKKEEEEVCFICFDGGNLVVCDRRGCPKVYHPACINRDEAFFRSRSRWNCGWHICSICQKASTYMCCTCTYSLCKNCIREATFFCVRDSKGFCETCYKTIMLIESDGQANEEKARIDFDDRSSWEYLFKVYWVTLKGKLSLTLDELNNAKNPWKGSGTLVYNEETSDELYDANDDQEASSDSSSIHHEGSKCSKKRVGRHSGKSADGEHLSKGVVFVDSEKQKSLSEDCGWASSSEDCRWASPELLEFVAHMKNGDNSVLSQFDVQALLLEYIKINSLRDRRRKSQIVCDARLRNLFGKARVGHFEMLKLLESHFLIKETPQIGTDDNQGGILDSDHGQMDDEEYNNLTSAIGSDKRRKTRKRVGERELMSNLDDYAAIDAHNINLIYLRRNLAEGLIDDDSFCEKVIGSFVRIRIPGAGQKSEMYRLVQVVGTQVVSEKYKVGKKSTDIALEILNLNKKESLTIDAISNQEFTEDECRRLRQSIKCGLISRLTVGDLLEKAKVLQEVRVGDWLESEKLRLSHLRDRASDMGRRKELRECIEKLQILGTPEERQRRINEVPEIHADPHMDPNYESPDEADDKKEVLACMHADNFIRSRESLSHRRGKKLLSPGAGSVSNHQWNGMAKSSSTSWSSIIEGAGDKMEELVSLGDRTKELSRNEKIVGWINNSETPKAHMNAIKPDTNVWKGNQLVNRAEQPYGIAPENMISSSGVRVPSNSSENDKVWNYQDPSGTIQGPFSIIQLRKWSSTKYFPPDLRIWLTSQKQEESMLLTDVLAKFQMDSQQQESQLTNFKQPSTFTGAAANAGHNWDIGWRENSNPTLVSVKQNDIAISTAGYNVSNIDRQVRQSSNYTEPNTELITRDGRIGVSTTVWESSKDTNVWHGQGGPRFSAPYSGYTSLAYQVTGTQTENAERWRGSQEQGSSWSSVRSGPLMPRAQGYEDQNPSWSPTSQQSHQLPLQYQKVQPAHSSRSQWANDAYGPPTPTPQPSSIDWGTNQSHVTAPLPVINPAQSVHHDRQAIPSAELHKSGTALMNSGGGWGSNSNSNALQSSASNNWVAGSATLVAAGDAAQNFVKVDNLDDSSWTNQQKKPSEYNSTVSSGSFMKKSQFFGSSCPSPTPSSEEEDGAPSQMNEPDPGENWKKPCGTADTESQIEKLVFHSHETGDSHHSPAATDKKQLGNVSSSIMPAVKPDVLVIDSVQNLDALPGSKLAPELNGAQHDPDSSRTRFGQAQTEIRECFPGPTDVFKAAKSNGWSLPSTMPASVMAENAADRSWVTTTLQSSNIGRAAHCTEGSGKADQANASKIGAIDQGSASLAWGTTQGTITETGWIMPTQTNTNANTGWATSAQGNGIADSSSGWGAPPPSNFGWETTIKASSGAGSGWGVGYTNQNDNNNTGWGTTVGNKNATWSSTAGCYDASDPQKTLGGYGYNESSEPRHGGGDNPQSRAFFGGVRGGGSSRPFRGQGQRGVCKFYESGHCKKGASCNYLHP
ncbi:hypothetical protein Cni_G18825 [Canna indica]|uniref:Zinc finger CCCH domain-containing protein 44 n=1 Tax=Canna indica TaxID=4628 RepID=A0AAQ3QER4_9LILI|nr:hypothetical protein Cni_G18825 [Canna indica]